ncbi:hypothetical protein BDK51DRAFT_47050 [Blyttiomyces helicus]|uniref:Uncharacterized protein n=1 Tax=Blyttiomyces helicus TaxID=388810 RepID=A0A4P9W4Z0_9FUNG|nr:hypothetical protein BDK51DRAFT_47050 [Blyttiomyces helicus]|eukprot:RKO86345.1 hypothetical protein BDK51DRAFT_47050 [Blyttiomyces helicus]
MPKQAVPPLPPRTARERFQRMHLHAPLTAWIVVFSSVGLATVGVLAWVVTFSRGQESVVSLAGAVLGQILQRITSEVLSHVQTAENAAATSKLNWGEGYYDPSEPLVASALLFNVLLTNVQVFATQTFTLVSGGNGSLFGHWARRGGDGQTEWVEWTQFGLNYTQQQVDSSNRLVAVEIATIGNTAVADESWVTSPLHRLFILASDHPGHRPCEYDWPSLDALLHGSYLGVASTDLTLDFLTEVLTAQSGQLQYDNYIYAFEIGANGEVCLGSSDGVDLYVRDASNAPQRSVTLSELAERAPPIAALDKALAVTPGSGGSLSGFAAEQGTSTASLSVNGAPYLVGASALDHGSLRWVVIQFVKEADVLMALTSGSEATGGIVAGVVAAFLIVAGVFSVYVGRALGYIVEDIVLMSQLKFEDILGEGSITDSSIHELKHPSRVKELHAIQASFLQLTETYARMITSNTRIASTKLTYAQPVVCPVEGNVCVGLHPAGTGNEAVPFCANHARYCSTYNNEQQWRWLSLDA